MNASWGHLMQAAKEAGPGWTAQASWPGTWYRTAADEGLGSYETAEDTLLRAVLFALYLTMRLLNPNVPAQRIGQSLFLPAGRPAIYDRFQAFYLATNRELLDVAATGDVAHSTTTTAQLASSLDSKAMTDDRIAIASAAAERKPRVVIHRGSLPAALEVDSSEAMSPPMQLFARDAARLVFHCDQVHFGQEPGARAPPTPALERATQTLTRVCQL